MFEALKKYAVFSGRARRKEYWLFVLLCLILGILAAIVDIAADTWDPEEGMGTFTGLLILILILPSIGVTVRRLHDIDKSGWWCLVQIIPLVGPLVMILFACREGTVGSNRFGEDQINEPHKKSINKTKNNNSSKINDIERLSKLLEQDKISQFEYEKLKKDLLWINHLNLKYEFTL